jgi:hypothetical protein
VAVTVPPPFEVRRQSLLLYGNLPALAVMAQWKKPKDSTLWVEVRAVAIGLKVGNAEPKGVERVHKVLVPKV